MLLNLSFRWQELVSCNNVSVLASKPYAPTAFSIALILLVLILTFSTYVEEKNRSAPGSCPTSNFRIAYHTNSREPNSDHLKVLGICTVYLTLNQTAREMELIALIDKAIGGSD